MQKDGDNHKDGIKKLAKGLTASIHSYVTSALITTDIEINFVGTPIAAPIIMGTAAPVWGWMTVPAQVAKIS